MFYVAYLFLNIRNEVDPIEASEIMRGYNTYDEAFKEFSSYVDHGNYVYGEEKTENSVTDYSVDIFNEYEKIYLIINANSYFDADDVLVRWVCNWLNDVLKEQWLKDQFENCPIWYALIKQEDDARPFDISILYEIDQKDRDHCIQQNIRDSMNGDAHMLFTKLAPIIYAKEYFDDTYVLKHYELCMYAQDEAEARLIAEYFMRECVEYEH